ncbi:MAG: glycosyltransferase family 2 protein [Pseudomarimonas sp.]
MNTNSARIAVVIPARDEALIIGQVVAELLALRRGQAALVNQVVVCDNGSADATAAEARLAGADVVSQSRPGYGIACLTALAAVDASDIVVFVDGDGSIDARELENLLLPFRNGADLVIGWRPHALSETGAMSLPQRLGNRIATALILLLFGTRFRDLGPYRAITSAALQRLHMSDPRYGWTAEMQLKALLHGMQIAEIPVRTRRRIGQSKISGTWRGVFGAARGIIGTILQLRLSSLAIGRGRPIAIRPESEAN